MNKRIVSLLLAMLLLLMCAVPAMAAAPVIKKTEYEGNGLVEVDFTTKNVRYKSAKVVVRDSAGKRLTVKILEKSSDDIVFKVAGLKANKKYTYTIFGVRAGKTGAYGSVKGSFKTPSNKPVISKVTFNPAYDDLEVEFATKVQYKNLKVTVTDADGDALGIYNLEKDVDELEMDVEGMIAGQEYTITVSGVRVKGIGSYIKVSKTFVA
jgi:hypothetical protein